MKKKNVKILIAYHKPSIILKNDIFVNIHVGRAVAAQKTKDGNISKKDYKWLLDNLIGDDTGENISSLNRYLCEMTALYWAWKNYDKIGNPDYIGLMHYRRHLIFNYKNIADLEKHDKFFCYYFTDFNELYGKNGYKDQAKIYNLISKYNIIHANVINHPNTVEKQFAELSVAPFYLKPEIFDNVIERIRKEKPEYEEAMDTYLKKKEQYWYNCFIMPKEMFFEYAEFAFDILLKEHNVLNYDNYSVEAKRVLGFISERLLGIFITKKVLFEGKTIKHIPLAFIENTNRYKILSIDKFVKSVRNICEKFKRIRKIYKYIVATTV